MTWVRKQLGNDKSHDTHDHVFSLVKHSNERFQLVQGYMAHNGAGDRNADSSGVDSNGMELHTWQNSAHRFSAAGGAENEDDDEAIRAHGGFSRRTMIRFLSLLLQFVEDDRFDVTVHEKLFGARLAQHALHDTE
eukprot:GEMP01082080.1.p1 GENE.GEMP01082080.1~~GEMP01082080.1.p1  ORF type:complete len:135 (+),score=36.98 GEMP01082080.1:284-688(+)